MRIKRVEYFDEKTMDAENEETKKANITRSDDGSYQRDVFACKRFQAFGITLSIEEYSARSRTSSSESVESFKTGSPTQHASIPVQIAQHEPIDDDHNTVNNEGNVQFCAISLTNIKLLA